MSKQEAVANHRKMWTWIASEIEQQKCAVFEEDYFKDMGILGGDVPLYLCYCCEYNDNHNDTISCVSCPIEWPTGHCCGKGLYGQWIYALDNGNWKKAANIAYQIAQLPERQDNINEC